MRLGIDLDGVVTNFTAGWMRFYNKQFGTTFIFEDSKNWGISLTSLTFRTSTNFGLGPQISMDTRFSGISTHSPARSTPLEVLSMRAIRSW